MKNVVEATIWNGKFRGVIIVFMQKINCWYYLTLQ
jgi:hypothetical protein